MKNIKTINHIDTTGLCKSRLSEVSFVREREKLENLEKAAKIPLFSFQELYYFCSVMKKRHELPVTFILDYDEESGYYASQIKEYPHVISQGKTQNEAIENAIDAFMEFVEMYKQKPTIRFRASRTRTIKQSNLLIHA